MSHALTASPVAARLARELEFGVQVGRCVLVHRQRLAQPKVGQLNRAIVKDEVIPAALARCGSPLHARRSWRRAGRTRAPPLAKAELCAQPLLCQPYMPHNAQTATMPGMRALSAAGVMQAYQADGQQ